MENINVPELVQRLGSDEDAVRKMAVFKLQSNIGDPSFADVFIEEGGLEKLRHLAMHATGNTLAYSLTSFSRLLEVDKGWDFVDQDLIERVVELVVTHPLVNILRGAMSMLACIVSHPYNTARGGTQFGQFGFRALKPAVAIYPQFLEMLVSRLSSADHALCANALQLINSLMRDAITNDTESEWPKFIKRLQDLGVIKAVYVLMQSSALQDLAHPLLEFQALTKVLLRKWRDVAVDLEKPEHRRALKGIHLASNPEKKPETPVTNGEDGKVTKHHPEKWRRLGFETESPVYEFEEMGFLGMMDLTDYVRRRQDEFQRILLEQSAYPKEQRCPIARASLAVTSVLYEHFEVDKSDLEDAKSYLALESRTNFDKVFKPLLLHWSRLHLAGLHAFFRLWKATGAEVEDFDKILDLIRILVESVVGGAPRTKDVSEVEEEISEYDYQRLRELQMELLELTYEDVWGQHLRQVRDSLHDEALQFVKEQRIRCLLQGAWFPNNLNHEKESGSGKQETVNRTMLPYRYVQLSHNRRYLHYADFDTMVSEVDLDMLSEKIDLSIVSSVTSNVSTTQSSSSSSSSSSPSTLKTLHPNPTAVSTTKITILGYLPSTSNQATRTNSLRRPTSSRANKPPPNYTRTQTHTHNLSKGSTTTTNAQPQESILLTLHPQSQTLASEFLDGLLMLLNQQPITAETSKLINLVSDYGLKIRLLNVRFDDDGSGGTTGSWLDDGVQNHHDGDPSSGSGGGGIVPPVPNRDGLGELVVTVKKDGDADGDGDGDGGEGEQIEEQRREDFWYDIPGGV